MSTTVEAHEREELRLEFGTYLWSSVRYGEIQSTAIRCLISGLAIVGTNEVITWIT